MSPRQAQDAPECSHHSLSTALHTGTRLNFSIHKPHLCPYVRLGITEPCESVSPERLLSSQGVTHFPDGPLGQVPRTLLSFNDVTQEHVLCVGGINPGHF